MRELDRIAQTERWTTNALAAKLGVHPSLLTHIRAGRALVSLQMLHTIRALFPTPRIREACDHYLDDELAAFYGARIEVPTTPDRFAALDGAVLRTLRAYVRTFARTMAETGRGLYLLGADTKRLALSALFLAETLAAQGVSTLRITGNAKIAGNDAKAALATALLVVERVDHASASVVELLLRRADAVKPIVLTSVADQGTIPDPYLRRVAVSMTKVVRVDIPSADRDAAV